jgi:hypothetical protein
VLKDFWALHKKELVERALAGKYLKAVAELDHMLGNAYFDTGHPHQAFVAYLHGLKTLPSPGNVKRFLWAAGKKIARLVTGDIVNRKKLGY